MPPVHRRLTPAERAEVEQFAVQAIACYPDALGSVQFLEASAALHRAGNVAYTWASIAALVVLHRGEATRKQAEVLERSAW